MVKLIVSRVFGFTYATNYRNFYTWDKCRLRYQGLTTSRCGSRLSYFPLDRDTPPAPICVAGGAYASRNGLSHHSNGLVWQPDCLCG